MRTNTLLLSAAIGVAFTATTVAQVYSVNAVGYVNVQLKPKAQILANPLDAGAGNNTVAKLFTGLPDGAQVFKYDKATGFQPNLLDFGEWSVPGMTLNPGEGFFVLLPNAATPVNVTFVGDVTLGAASNMQVPAGLQLLGSKVPQAGKLTTDLKFPATDGDQVYKWNYDTQAYQPFLFDFGAWEPEPTIAVAEGFWVSKVGAAAWDRNFSIAGP